MILALDHGGVISRWPQQMRMLADCVLACGGKVYIISANEPPIASEDLKKQFAIGFPYTDFIGNEISCDSADWKADVCRQLGVELFIDDLRSNVIAVQGKGIAAVQAICE